MSTMFSRYCRTFSDELLDAENVLHVVANAAARGHVSFDISTRVVNTVYTRSGAAAVLAKRREKHTEGVVCQTELISALLRVRLVGTEIDKKRITSLAFSLVPRRHLAELSSYASEEGMAGLKALMRLMSTPLLCSANSLLNVLRPGTRHSSVPSFRMLVAFLERHSRIIPRVGYEI